MFFIKHFFTREGLMNFELNKEYNLRVVQVPANQGIGKTAYNRKMVKRVKIVAIPVENEAVIEFIGAKRYFQGVGLPVRGRIYIVAGIPSYLSSGNEKYEIMNVLV